MGMAIAFDPNRADFSLMLDNPGKAKENLYIGEVRHKTFCRVDELGTEASAVTSVEMRTTGMIAEPETKLIFDRPFIYGIVDEVTGAPLFLGIMENPLEK
jgi:serine protease inhibitor